VQTFFRRAFFTASLLFTTLGLLILGRCIQLSIELGGWDYGDFNQYAWVGYTPTSSELTFADWPTGERPEYSYIPAWYFGLACIFISAICFGLSRLVAKQFNRR
jgi:hypothetical protein